MAGFENAFAGHTPGGSQSQLVAATRRYEHAARNPSPRAAIDGRRDTDRRVAETPIRENDLFSFF